MGKRKTTEEFIQQAEMVHGKGKYDYSLVEYVNAHTPVEMSCYRGHNFRQKPNDHLNGHGCKYCANNKRLTTEEFVAKAKSIHGDKFDYSEVVYKNDSTPIMLTCNFCGNRWETTPNKHLRYGCPECARFDSRKPIYGIGINDYHGRTKVDGVPLESYKIWFLILNRLYSPKTLEREPSYKDVKLCPEWIYFSNFKQWFDSNVKYYHKGWQLDKDLLSRHKRISIKTYSKDTCCFLPHEINSALSLQKELRTDLPIGVRRSKSGKFYAILCAENKSSKHLGTFDTLEEAFATYKKAKESWLKFLANKYKSELDPRAYSALMEYEVRIDD